jgi:ABC-2 type transport system permease protein
MPARIWTITSKELIQFFRNRLLVLLILLGPWTELVLVAYSTSVGIERLPTAVVDMDITWASRRLVQMIDNTSTFQVGHYLDNAHEVQAMLQSGRISMAVLIPRGFAKGCAAPQGRAPQLEVLLDGSEPAAAQAAQNAIEGVIASFSQEISRQWSATMATNTAGQVAVLAPLPGGLVARAAAFDSVAGSRQSIQSAVRVWFNEEMSEANYTVPSEVGFMLAAVTLMVASLGIAKEREMGTLEQLTVTPLRSLELIVGKAVPAVILAYGVFLAMLGISIVGFGIPMRGSWALLLVLALFYIFVELGWGIMISAVSNTQMQALMLVFLLIMVEMVFSGYAFPIEVMPRPLQFMSNLVPIKHWLLIFRAILLKGVGFEVIWRQVLALAILGTAVLGMTVLVLRRKQF